MASQNESGGREQLKQIHNKQDDRSRDISFSSILWNCLKSIDDSPSLEIR